MCYHSKIKSIQPNLAKFVRSRVYRREDAEDIVQNTNVILVNKRKDYDKNKNFQSWVFTIAGWQIKRYLTELQRSRIVYFGCNSEEMGFSHSDGRV